MATFTLSVPNKSGSYDGDMVVRHYTSLSISSGNVLTTDYDCRGLLIYVQGNCTINGTLSMRGRAPYANPTVGGASDGNAVSSAGLRFPFLKAGGSSTITADSSLLNGCGNDARYAINRHKNLTGNGVIAALQRQGANGGGQTANGQNGDTGQTGGGGGGGRFGSTAGSGSYGSCWGGGSGGGGSDNANASSAQPWCGAGGNGGGAGSWTSTGGAGNPAGRNGNEGIIGWRGTGYGAGGAIILIVGGNLTIGSGGLIDARGVDMPRNSGSVAGGGGGAGGGNILIAVKGSYTNNGTITAAGGLGDRGTQTGSGIGGNGGNGSIQIITGLA